jgi:soluble lytic murein transglycosylase
VSDETLGWLVRAGLRGRDWKLVRGAIERMTETGRADPAWRYWWAKSVAAEGRTDEANQQMRAIAGPWNFYGLLAADELGLVQTLPARPPPPSDDELAEVMGHSGVIRALKFADLNLRTESVKEMAFTVRTLSDRQILALSEALRRRGLHDRSIAVAERTVATHDPGLRFPTPYRDLVSEAARAQDLEPAFVYGLVRQESRFLAEARSGVGAAGLMQLMPATAKWVARKVGANGFTPGRIHEPDLNLRFGSFYLRRVLDELDGSPMLAAAAYNAGPGRPKAWRASLPVGVEGAAFAETIPFTETRDYVKKVLANSVAYAALLEAGTTGQRLPSLKTRLGQVAPRAAVPGEAP